MQVEGWESFFFVTLFSSFSLSLVVGLLILIPLHISLCRRFDPLLFKSPFFKERELSLLAAWPFSIIKSMSYMLLIIAPGLVKKKYHNVNVEVNPHTLEKVGVYLYFLAISIALFSIMALLVWLIIDVIIS